jgi:hypothetical protein
MILYDHTIVNGASRGVTRFIVLAPLAFTIVKVSYMVIQL